MTQSAQERQSKDQMPMLSRGGWLSRNATLLLLVYWPLLVLATHLPNPHLPGPPLQHLGVVLQTDKFAHVVAFGGLMVLVLFSDLSGRKLAWRVRCTIALAICLSYAVIDELTQTYMPGRSVSTADLVTNFVAIIGVYLIAREPSDAERRRLNWLVRLTLLLSIPLLMVGLFSPWFNHQLFLMTRELFAETDWISRPLDQWAHGVLAFFTSVTLIGIWPLRSRRPKRAAALLLLILLLSGPAIEIVQFYTGRGAEAADVYGHTIGVLAAMALWMALPRREQRTGLAYASNAASDGIADISQAFVGHAIMVSLMTMLSRFAGLARDAVLAAALGLSAAADAFFIGFLVPNLFRRLFGEGALTAAFIPNYTELLERDPALAKRFATLTITLLAVLLVGITLIAELVLWWIASSIDDTHKASLAIRYTRLMLPYMPLICVVALIGGVLQVHKRFGPPAATPLVLNGVIVGAVLLATGLFHKDTPPATVATWAAVGVVIAGVLQLYWQAAVLLQVTELSRSFKGTWPTMRSMLIMMGPMVLGLAVFQINALLDAMIAFFFAPGQNESDSDKLSLFGHVFDAPLRNGDVAALSWSQRLYQFPLGVFGIAIATAIFPALSAAAAKFTKGNDGEEAAATPQAASDEFARIVRQGLRLTVFIALPASAGLILVRVPLARTVFEHGSFTTEDALRVSVILAGYAASVWAYSMTHTLTRAFYALKDATTPLKVSACMVLLNLALNLSLIWSLGAAGLAWSTAISAVGQVVLLILLLRKRVDKPIDDSVIASWTRTMVATTVMAGLLFAIDSIAGRHAETWSQSAVLLAGLVLVGVAVFFVIARLAKAEELGWLRKRGVK
ncbi:MAG: murein biosynthesis integral membrane protein MurJ [Planctomycetota bacterium]